MPGRLGVKIGRGQNRAFFCSQKSCILVIFSVILHLMAIPTETTRVTESDQTQEWRSERATALERFAAWNLPPEFSFALDFCRYEQPMVEDDRLRFKIDESQLGKKHHRPEGQIASWHSGESTSWNFILRAYLQEKTNVYGQEIIRISKLQDKDAVIQELDSLRREIFTQMYAQMDRYVSVIWQYLPQGFHEKNQEATHHFFVAGSGGKAINALNELFAWEQLDESQSFADFFQNPGKIVTTDENGSEVTAGAKDKSVLGVPQQLDEVRYRDPASNAAFPPQEILKQYQSKMGTDRARVSFTLMPKTGLDDASILEAFLGDVAQNNQGQHQQQVSLDMVQYAGRKPLVEFFQPLSLPHASEQVNGWSHTASKALEAVPHAGVFVLMPKALDRLKAFCDKAVEQGFKEELRDWLQKIVDKYQIVLAPFFQQYGVDLSKQTLTAIRAQDNLDAFCTAYDPASPESADEFQLFGERAKQFSEVYKNFFRFLGFKVLESDVPSIIPVEPPRRLLANELEKTFLFLLAKGKGPGEGISMGGFMQNADFPILRWGMKRSLLQERKTDGTLWTPQDLEQKLYGSVTYRDFPSADTIIQRWEELAADNTAGDAQLYARALIETNKVSEPKL
jgi:hypothetical protein